MFFWSHLPKCIQLNLTTIDFITRTFIYSQIPLTGCSWLTRTDILKKPIFHKPLVQSEEIFCHWVNVLKFNVNIQIGGSFDPKWPNGRFSWFHIDGAFDHWDLSWKVVVAGIEIASVINWNGWRHIRWETLESMLLPL